MVKLIVGVRGTGKTKTLIEMVNGAVASSKGSVICIEKGNKLNYDITHKARLIDVDAYAVEDAQALYGFIGQASSLGAPELDADGELAEVVASCFLGKGG